MTRLLLPFLLCAPILAHAQNNSSKAFSTATLSPGPLVSAIAATATPPAAAADSSRNTLKPVFQGVNPPKLVHTIAMKDDGNQHVHIEGRQRIVLVDLTVNEAGQPTDLHLPEPVDAALDVEVLATVGKFRYLPGTLNGKPIPMAVHMHYVVPVGAIY